MPDPESEGATTQEIAIPNPPPPPPPPPNVEPPRQRDDEVEDEEMAPISFSIDDPGGLAPWAAVAVGVAAVPIGLLLALRARRSSAGRCCAATGGARRPSPTARIAGAWAEAIDRCTEAGAPPMTAVTPHERVQAYVRDQHLDEVEPDLRVLAGQVDRATYAASAPDDGHADDAWRASDEVSAELRRTRTRCATVAHAPRSPPPAPRPRDVRRSAAPAGPPVTDARPPEPPDDEDDDVTVPGDHELLAELRGGPRCRARRTTTRPGRAFDPTTTTTSRSAPTTT